MAAGDHNNAALTEAAEKAFAKPFGAVLKLAPDGAPPIWIDGGVTPPAVNASLTKADCAWHGSEETLLRALSSERAMESAFVAGRITVSGDMSVMARLCLKGTR